MMMEIFNKNMVFGCILDIEKSNLKINYKKPVDILF